MQLPTISIKCMQNPLHLSFSFICFRDGDDDYVFVEESDSTSESNESEECLLTEIEDLKLWNFKDSSLEQLVEVEETLEDKLLNGSKTFPNGLTHWKEGCCSPIVSIKLNFVLIIF